MTESVTFLHTKDTDKKARFDAPTGAAVEGSLYILKDKAKGITALTVTVDGK